MSIEYNALQEKLCELQGKLEGLQPEVDKWQRFNTKWCDFQIRKVSFLKSQERSLKQKLLECKVEKEKRSLNSSKVKERRAILEGILTRLNLEADVLRRASHEMQKKWKLAVKQHEILRMNMIKAKVRCDAAEKDANIQRVIQDNHLKELTEQQNDVEKKIKSLSQKIGKLEVKKASLYQHKQQLEGDKLMVISHDLPLETQENNMNKLSFMEEAEADLTVRILRVQEKLKAVEERKARQAAQVSQLAREVGVLESTETMEYRKKQEQEIASLQEVAMTTHQDVDKASLYTLPALRKDLTETQLEIHHLQKRLRNSQHNLRTPFQDDAVTMLMVALKGRLHGRLTDLATVTCNMLIPVNSIMIHVINTSMTFVAEDRATACEAIQYFQDHKIGIVTCEILSEVVKMSEKVSQSSFGEHAAVDTVMNYIDCAERYRPVFWKYFRNWCVVKDRDSATQCLKCKSSYGTFNIVTSTGDLFKQDGEVISASKSLSGKFLLKSSNNDILERSAENSNFCSENEIQLCKETLRHLSQKKSLIEADIVAEEKKLEIFQSRKSELQAQLRRCMQGTRCDSSAILDCVRTRLREKQAELSQVRKTMEDTEEEGLLQQEIQKLAQQHREVTKELGDLRCQLLKPEAIASSEKIRAIEEEIRHTDSNVMQAISSVKSLNKRLDEIRLNITNSSSTDTIIPPAGLNEEFAILKEHVSQAESIKDKLLLEMNSLKPNLVQIEQELGRYIKKKSTLQKKEAELLTELDELLVLEKVTENQIAKVRSALSDCPKSKLSKRVCSDQDDILSFNQNGSICEDEGIVLAQEEQALNDLRRTINADALDEDLNCRKRGSNLSKEMEVLSAMLNSEHLLKDNLESARFNTFRSVMIEVNKHLSKVYSGLTKHGDAYLSFTEEKGLLFIDGVSLKVRPDWHKWRSFNSLSGGQQALAALALSFSLQSVFPSPFYFFDEIDAALDTKNAQLVAEYIKKQGMAQYIVVSHKPQVYEHASTLIGVYHFRGSSNCITAAT